MTLNRKQIQTMDINNKTALITGGTKGIGKAIAENLLKQGVNVCITGRSKGSIDSAVSELKSQYGDKITGIEVDVRDYNGQVACVQKIVERYGKLDILIANAGLGHFAPIDEMSTQQWNETIDINLTGVFNSVKASLDQIKSNEGYIITIASLAGTNFFESGSAYNASKFGLVGFTQAIMLDLRKYGVKVSTIMPGSVSTEFNDNQPSDKDAWKIQPEDIAQLTSDLLHMDPRTLPSKIEVRPTIPGGKK